MTPDARAIDLNCDAGELEDALLEEALIALVSSVNIACGGHTGDDASMARTVAAARRHGVAIGAHPSHPDRANFGRVELSLPPEAVEESTFAQVTALARIAGDDLRHAKPHGALYHQCAKDRAIAEAFARGAIRAKPGVALVGPAGALDTWRAFTRAALLEGFADRTCEPDGSLRKRGLPGALLTEPAAAAAQAVRLAESGTFATLCIHADTPGAVTIASAVRSALVAAGFRLAAPESR